MENSVRSGNSSKISQNVSDIKETKVIKKLKIFLNFLLKKSNFYENNFILFKKNSKR